MHFPETFAHYLDLGQGLRVGESSVISKRVHKVDKAKKGRVVIFSNLDAGEVYLGAPKETCLHLDVFHAFSPDLDLDPLESALPVKAIVRGEANHIHLLLPLASLDYHGILRIVDSAESYLISQGVEIRKVEELTHKLQRRPRLSASAGFSSSTTSQLAKEQTILFLAGSVGSVEAGLELLESLDGQKGAPNLSRLSHRHGGLTMVLNQLISEGLVKRGLWGYGLTETGEDVLEYAHLHQRELEAEFRQTIRKVPVPKGELVRTSYSDRHKSRPRNAERGQVVPLSPGEWATNLAISETVVAAVKNNFIQGKGDYEINRADLRIHQRRQHIPMDILLLIDASTSMRGKRLRAAQHLAEHLILTTRERVGVVVFQEQRATLASGFTRNYDLLRRGLRSVEAKGLTPLSSGIIESLKLLKNSQGRNPLLILITDGLPTIPLKGKDPIADALAAAELIPESKARLVIIGLKPDAGFLDQLAARAKGNLYVVDDLEKDLLMSIIRKERLQFL